MADSVAGHRKCKMSLIYLAVPESKEVEKEIKKKKKKAYEQYRINIKELPIARSGIN